jgi:hypothetical protein
LLSKRLNYIFSSEFTGGGCMNCPFWKVLRYFQNVRMRPIGASPIEEYLYLSIVNIVVELRLKSSFLLQLLSYPVI